MVPGTESYRGCIGDLQQFRAGIERRLAAEDLF
jgi:hypothetical protein